MQCQNRLKNWRNKVERSYSLKQDRKFCEEEVVEYFTHYTVIEGLVTSSVGGTDIIFDDKKLCDILGFLLLNTISMLRVSCQIEK